MLIIMIIIIIMIMIIHILLLLLLIIIIIVVRFASGGTAMFDSRMCEFFACGGVAIHGSPNK